MKVERAPCRFETASKMVGRLIRTKQMCVNYTRSDGFMTCNDWVIPAGMVFLVTDVVIDDYYIELFTNNGPVWVINSHHIIELI